MIAVLLCLGAAALTWPAAGAPHRTGRLRGAGWVPSRLGRPRGWTEGPVALGAAAVAAGAAGTLASTPVVGGLAGIGAGLGVAAARRRRRAAAGRRQVAALAEALGVLAAELRAGRSVDDAAATAVADCPDPLTAAALGPVLRLGRPPPLDSAGPAPAATQVLARVAAAVRLSARTGCSLAGVVTAVEDDLRAGARAEAELRAAVAGPRASAAVLAGLPVLGLLMGSGVGADPWRVLTTTGTGTVLLVAGTALEVAGVAWSAQLVARAVRS